jgi:hypothetical protein
MLILAASTLLYPKPTTPQFLPTPCVAGHTAAATGFWTWPANSRVNVYLRAPDFSEDYVESVGVAVKNWDTAAEENGSNVHLIFRGLTHETMIGQGEMTIVRGDIYDKKIRHLALLQAHSLRSDQVIDYAVVVVDLRVKNPGVLTNVMAHEIGHSLGLLDCYGCSRKSTAMGLMKSGEEPNGIEGPTACDKVSVRAAYRELALHVKRAPNTQAAEDEGEEPEADDAPVVRPPQ